MSEQTRIFEPAEIQAVPSAALPLLDIWLVIAFWAPGGHWKVFREQWLSKERALDEVAKLPRGFICPHILHVRLPELKAR